jgi:DNA helicase-2/ATP-dependent DNA helicase PcrA
VLAVGDDDQSIYAFRGARVGNMADFVREFEVRHQIKLEQNYRSFSNILDSANALIAHNKTRLGKNLRTDQGPGEPVRVYEAPTDMAEAQWMVEEIRHLVRAKACASRARDRGALSQQRAEPGDRDCAVQRRRAVPRVRRPALLRARRNQARAVLPAPAGEPARRHQLPARGELPGARHRRAQHRAVAGRGARGRHVRCTTRSSATTGKAGANLAAFVAKIDAMRVETEGLTPARDHRVMLQRSGLVDHYKAERDGADRIENLEELVNAAESFVTQEGFGRDAVALPVDELGARCCASRRPARASIRASPILNEPRPTTCRRMPRPARRCRRWPPSSRTRRSSRATTRRRPARTRCS